jgi:regulator of replication initiation timing
MPLNEEMLLKTLESIHAAMARIAEEIESLGDRIGDLEDRMRHHVQENHESNLDNVDGNR